MKQYTGKSASEGIAIGPVLEIAKNDETIPCIQITHAEDELAKFDNAIQKTREQLKELYQTALREVGEKEAAVFEVYQMLLTDATFTDAVRELIRKQKINAGFAVSKISSQLIQMFSSLEDEYMRERAADVMDVSNRLLDALGITRKSEYELTVPCIIAADNLAPSEAVRLDKTKVLAFVVRQGSKGSHAAILAKTRGIPMIVQADFPRNVNGKTGIADGYLGEIIIEPDEAVVKDYQKKQMEEAEKKCRLQELKERIIIKADGKQMRICANIDSAEDIEAVLHNGADGVGLFRSEFVFLQSKDYPSEEEQFKSYLAAGRAMGDKRIIIRTLDIGADKQIDYFGLEKEENPALGYRAIRICLTREDMFKVQLRAIYRAGVQGNLAIMLPMITSVWEVRKAREIADRVREELNREGIPVKEIPLGVMIETPAAVMISEELAKEADFFSIGTNDLTQYALAVDRQNQKLENFYDVHHPAILRMIQMTVENAHKAGIQVGICGELAADTSLSKTFFELGVDELSMPPSMILPVKREILA